MGTASKKDGVKTVNSWGDSMIREAVNCSKTMFLQDNASQLSEETNTDLLSDVAPFNPTEKRDVSGPQTLSCAAFLDYTAQDTRADMPEVLQVPWLMVEEPSILISAF